MIVIMILILYVQVAQVYHLSQMKIFPLNTNCESLFINSFPKLCLLNIFHQGICAYQVQKVTVYWFWNKTNISRKNDSQRILWWGKRSNRTIFIPNEFNSQCEFTFKTNFDNKEYTYLEIMVVNILNILIQMIILSQMIIHIN